MTASQHGAMSMQACLKAPSLAPGLFVIMVDDINVPGVDDFWRYVDDSTMSESVAKNYSSLLQSHVSIFVEKSIANGMELKETKCK